MELYNDPQMSERLPETGDDLVDDKQIHASRIAPGIIEHRSYHSDSSRDIWNEVRTERWRFVRPLGRGGFGHVFLEEKMVSGTQGLQPQLRAVKAIPEKEGGVMTKLHLAEILGMAKFSRKYGASFIQLFAWFALGSDICIAMEWAPYGDLEDCVIEPLPEDEARDIARQLSLAILIMHERRFLHRDLKPKNIFVFRKPPESIGWRVKLGDFGVSKRVRETADTSWHTSIEADCSAPEVRGLLNGDNAEETSYANPVDMWSLGYVVHWLLTKRYPVSTMALPRHCFKMQPLPLTGLVDVGASTQASAFVEKLLQLRPDQRMSAQQACSHSWLSKSESKLPRSIEMFRTNHVSRMIFPDPVLQRSQSTGTQLGYMPNTLGEDILRDRLNPTTSGEQRRLSLRGLENLRITPQPGHPLVTDKLLIQEREAMTRAADIARIRNFEYHPKMTEPTWKIPRINTSIAIRNPNDNTIVDLKKATSSKDNISTAQPELVSPVNFKNDTVSHDDNVEHVAMEAKIAAWEVQEALAEIEENRREEEYRRKKVVQREANLKREEEEAAAYNASLSRLEHQAEVEEDRRMAELDDQKLLEQGRDLFKELRKSDSSVATNDEKAADTGDLRSINHVKDFGTGRENSHAIDAHYSVPQPRSAERSWENKFKALISSSTPVSNPTESSSPQSRLSKNQRRRQKKKQQQQAARR